MRELRILIVEDEFLSRKLLESHIESYGSCELADDGQGAIDAVKLSYEEGRPFDIVFLDIMLPLIDGLTALREIRAYEAGRGVEGGSACKVIMVTALNDAQTVMDSCKNRCEGYVTKPYSKKMLADAIARLNIMER
jgi:two-component system, chemotaxis family, chemotaxis protein CheY